MKGFGGGEYHNGPGLRFEALSIGGRRIPKPNRDGLVKVETLDDYGSIGGLMNLVDRTICRL